MQPAPQRFFDAVRNPYAIVCRLEVWFGGQRVDTYGDAGIPVYGGEVDVDPGKQVRRTLTNVKVDATDEMWDLLSPVGTELRAYRGFRYINGELDMVPLGRFVVPNLSETFGGDWSGQIGSASDRMIRVQKARFTSPRAIPAGVEIRQVIAGLMGEVLGDVTVLATSTALTGSGLLFEKDRGDAIGKLAPSIGADVFIAADGTPTVADLPQIGDPVWTINANADDAILYTGTRATNYDRTYSGVVATPAQIDGAAPFDPVVVWDENPYSPTYHLGPFGEAPYFFTSPLLADAAQAYNAAVSLLPKVTAVQAQLTLEAECNPALSDGDTITVILPPRRPGGRVVTEQHMVGSFTIPLTPDGTQRIDTASAQTVADSE